MAGVEPLRTIVVLTILHSPLLEPVGNLCHLQYLLHPLPRKALVKLSPLLAIPPALHTKPQSTAALAMFVSLVTAVESTTYAVPPPITAKIAMLQEP